MGLAADLAATAPDLSAALAAGVSYEQLAAVLRAAILAAVAKRGLVVTVGTGGFTSTISLEQARSMLAFCEDQIRGAATPITSIDVAFC